MQNKPPGILLNEKRSQIKYLHSGAETPKPVYIRLHPNKDFINYTEESLDLTTLSIKILKLQIRVRINAIIANF